MDCIYLVSKCTIIKKLKTNKPRYGKLYVKVAEATPWTEVHVDIIGPYTINTHKLDAKDISITLTLSAIIFIDPSAGWFEIVEVPSEDKTLARISRLFNQNWLHRYPMPK